MKSNLLLQYLRDRKEVGAVHSVFTKGFNVQFPTQLVFVGSCEAPLSAFGLAVTAERMSDLLSKVRKGDLVVYKSDRLFIYSVAGVMTIDLSGLCNVDLSLPKVKCDISAIAGTAVFRQLAAMGLEHATGLGCAEDDRERLELLWNSGKADLDANCKLVSHFAGRGPGLTPSGDDLLLGFTLALMLFGEYASWQKAIATGINENTTTRVSVAYLQAMLLGYVSEHLVQLAAMMDSGDSLAVQQHVERVVSFGHTSGMDTLFGFFLGLKFLTR